MRLRSVRRDAPIRSAPGRELNETSVNGETPMSEKDNTALPPFAPASTGPFDLHEADGVLTGPVRSPRNSARHLGAGSIHDDATAQKLGFRGGTVAGSLHMEQLPPLLMALFGPEWLRTGGMSMYFRYATTDGEPVRASLRRPLPAAARTELWMDDARGNRVCDGTASVGAPDMGSLLRQRIAATATPGELRILAGVEVGVPGAAGVVRLGAEIGRAHV